MKTIKNLERLQQLHEMIEMENTGSSLLPIKVPFDFKETI